MSPRHCAAGDGPPVSGLKSSTLNSYVRDYLDEVNRSDSGLSVVSKRDPVVMRRLLRSLARNTATEASLTTLAADSVVNDRCIATRSVAT